MAKTREAKFINQFLEGAQTNLSLLIQSPNSLKIADGVNTSYQLGAILKDVGYSRVGDVASSAKSITGLHNFRQTASTQKILRTKNNDAGTNLLLQYNNAGTWTNINVGTSYDAFEDAKVEMEDFIGYCFIVGYDSTDNVWLPPASLTNTTFSTSTNVTSMPNGKYIIRYRDRLYVINCYYSATAYPYRSFFSSVPTAGAITWTPASDYIDVDFSESLTGGGSNWDRLVLFTEYSAYMYDQSQKKKVWDVGCSSHRSIANSGQYMMWANYDGVWRSTGGQPENIGGPVIDFIRKANPRNFVAKVVDEEYRLFVGTVTVDGVPYSNCELTFNIPTSQWRWRELAHVVTIYERYNNSGEQRLYLGTSIGEVYDRSKYTDTTIISSDGYIDANNIGSPIHSNFSFILPLSNFGEINALRQIITYANRAMGLKMKYRFIDRDARSLSPFIDLGEITKYIQKFNIQEANGVILEISGVEYGSNPYWSFLGCAIEYDVISAINTQ